jgi:hypothetical protein
MVQQDVSAAVVEHDLESGEPICQNFAQKPRAKSAARTLHARASHIEYR